MALVRVKHTEIARVEYHIQVVFGNDYDNWYNDQPKGPSCMHVIINTKKPLNIYLLPNAMTFGFLRPEYNNVLKILIQVLSV